MASASHRGFCESALTTLFDDSEDDVRGAAARCFRELKADQLGEYTTLVEAFVGSAAFEKHHSDVIYALEHTTALLPELTCAVCRRFLETIGLKVGDTHFKVVAESRRVSTLLVRAYGQAGGETLRGACLDVIDRMMQAHGYGLDDAMAMYER